MEALAGARARVEQRLADPWQPVNSRLSASAVASLDSPVALASSSCFHHGALRVLPRMSSGAFDDRRAGHLLRHVLLVPSSGRIRPLPYAVPLSQEKAIQASAKVQLGRGHDLHGRHEGAGARDAVACARVQDASRTDGCLSRNIHRSWFISGRSKIAVQKNKDVELGVYNTSKTLCAVCP